MFTNGALKQLIALEEKKPDHGQLITSAYDTDEFFVPAPFEWQLGSFFVGVLNTNHERVSVFMHVGAVDDNRLCVTIDHAPIPLSFTMVKQSASSRRVTIVEQTESSCMYQHL
jgi:hypothetical protein